MNKTLLLFILLFLSLSAAVNAQWTALNSALGHEIKVMVKNGNALIAGTADGGVYVSADAGQNWVQKNSGLSNLKVYSLASNGSLVAAGTYGGGVFLSNNNGDSWSSTASISVPYIYSVGFVGGNILAGTGGAGLFLSSDNGSKWSNVFPSSYGVYAIYPGTTATSYCGIGPYICKSTDGGNVWFNVIASNTTIKAYAETPTSGGGLNLFVGSLDGMFLSTDGGKNWKTINSGLSYRNVNTLAVSGPNVFAGTDNGGVYLTTDNGTNWQEINTGFPQSTSIKSLIIDGNTMYAAASSGIVYKRALSDVVTGVEDAASGIPDSFTLEQNYPNPFNPETTIRFSIPMSTGTVVSTSLRIYDILGREVATLVNEQKAPGSYAVKFDASGIPSGIYFYRMDAGSSSEIKKMMLLK